MALCRFSYWGTSPATVCAFTVNPRMGDWTVSNRWRSPRLQAGGREDSFVFNKSIVQTVHTLRWGSLPAADKTALLAFLIAVDGMSNVFDYTDPAGVYWTARIWNSREIRAALVDFNRSEITIVLLVTAKPNLIVNGDWTGASGTTPPDDWLESLGDPTFSVTDEWLTIVKGSAYNPGISQPVTTVAGKTYIFRANSISATGASLASARVGTTLGGVDLGTDQNSLVLEEHELQITFTAAGTTTYVSLHNTTTGSGEARLATPSLYEIGA